MRGYFGEGRWGAFGVESLLLEDGGVVRTRQKRAFQSFQPFFSVCRRGRTAARPRSAPRRSDNPRTLDPDYKTVMRSR